MAIDLKFCLKFILKYKLITLPVVQQTAAGASEFPSHAAVPLLFPVARQPPAPSALFPAAQRCPSHVAIPAPAGPESALAVPAHAALGARDLSELEAPTLFAATELLKRGLS